MVRSVNRCAYYAPAVTLTLTLTLGPTLALGPVVVSGTQDVKWEGQVGRAQSYDPVTKKYKVKLMDGKPVRQGAAPYLHPIGLIALIKLPTLAN